MNVQEKSSTNIYILLYASFSDLIYSLRRWKEMSEEDKMPYTKMAELCKQKHEKVTSK